MGGEAKTATSSFVLALDKVILWWMITWQSPEGSEVRWVQRKHGRRSHHVTNKKTNHWFSNAKHQSFSEEVGSCRWTSYRTLRVYTICQQTIFLFDLTLFLRRIQHKQPQLKYLATDAVTIICFANYWLKLLRRLWFVQNYMVAQAAIWTCQSDDLNYFSKSG